jgi:hypothetical protein
LEADRVRGMDYRWSDELEVEGSDRLDMMEWGAIGCKGEGGCEGLEEKRCDRLDIIRGAIVMGCKGESGCEGLGKEACDTVL